MEFSKFNKIVEGNKTIFKNIQPLVRIQEILYYKEVISGPFDKKEFRWSFNNNYWSPWVELNQGNLTNIKITNINLFLEIRYISAGGKVNNFILGYEGEKQNITDNKTITKIIKEEPKEVSIEANIYEQTGECTIKENVLIDANSLCGKDCDYYLWLPNHKGNIKIEQVTNLEEVLKNLNDSLQLLDIQGADNISKNGIGVYYGTYDKKLYFKTLIQGTGVLLSENTKGEITIKMDDSSINNLYEKIGQFNAINIGDGTGKFFKQKDGSLFEFRSLKSDDEKIIIKTSDNNILISLDPDFKIPEWTDLTPVSATVGGIDAGDIVDLDSNSIEILERILYDYKQPELNLNINPEPGYYEKYSNFGEIYINGDFNNNPFKKVQITNIKITNSLGYEVGNQNYNDVSSGIFNFIDPNYNPNYNDFSYRIELYNKVGTTYMNTLIKNVYYKFINPFYFGIVDKDVTIDNIYYTDIVNLNKLLVPKQDNIINYNVEENYKPIKFVYAFDETYESLKTIWDIKNNFNVTNSFDTKIIPIRLDSGDIINYRVYLKSHWISFTPDVSVFKIKFNF